MGRGVCTPTRERQELCDEMSVMVVEAEGGNLFSLCLPDDGDRLFRLIQVPLSRSEVMVRHSQILVLHTFRSIGDIARDIIQRSIRRAQLFHFVCRPWGKTDRRHLANVARQFSVGNEF